MRGAFVAASVCFGGVGVVDHPVFPAIVGRKKTTMTGCPHAVFGRLGKYGLRVLPPVFGLHKTAARVFEQAHAVVEPTGIS